VYPLLAFRRKVRSLDAVASGPLVVHCSAGVGRSGTYIALDTLLDEVKLRGEVDILAVVTYLRRQRMMLVQTKVSESLHKQLPVPSICRIGQASVYLQTSQRSICTSISISSSMMIQSVWRMSEASLRVWSPGFPRDHSHLNISPSVSSEIFVNLIAVYTIFSHPRVT